MPVRRGIEVARRALDVALDAVPGSVVEKVTSRTAPLSRYSGRTRAGAAALASALTMLAQPPRRRHRRTARLSLEDLAAQTGEDAAVVRRWADDGLLGPPRDDGTWDRDALDRATLLSLAADHGTTDEELRSAVADGRLPLLALEHVIQGDATLSARQVAARAGVPLDTALAVWRALGMPAADVDAPAFTGSEVTALRTLNAMRAVFTDDDLVEASSVVGRAMGDVGAAAVELFRRRLTARFVESGANELDVSLRLAAMVDLLVPPLGPLLEVVLRRHLAASARAEAALQIEESASPSAQRELSVAFADMVGFTTTSERLTALEVSRLAARLLRSAETVLPQHGARIVKSIGDAVMFTARDPVSCAAAAVALVDAAAADDALPPVRVGIAHGPVLRAYADYFGRTVNVASRLCDAAAAGEVLLLQPEDAPPDSAWARAHLSARAGSRLRLKGIDGRVAVLRITADGAARATPRETPRP